MYLRTLQLLGAFGDAFYRSLISHRYLPNQTEQRPRLSVNGTVVARLRVKR